MISNRVSNIHLIEHEVYILSDVYDAISDRHFTANWKQDTPLTVIRNHHKNHRGRLYISKCRFVGSKYGYYNFQHIENVRG